MSDRLTDERLAELAQRPQRTFLTEVPLLVAEVRERRAQDQEEQTSD